MLSLAYIDFNSFFFLAKGASSYKVSIGNTSAKPKSKPAPLDVSTYNKDAEKQTNVCTSYFS